MLNYIHNIPTKVYFGEGAISHLEETLKPFGTNVLLTYGGGSIKKSGLYDTVMEILNKGGFKVVELSGIDPNPRIESVEKGVALCKEHAIDVILAIGGGNKNENDWFNRRNELGKYGYVLSDNKRNHQKRTWWIAFCQSTSLQCRLC